MPWIDRVNYLAWLLAMVPILVAFFARALDALHGPGPARGSAHRLRAAPSTFIPGSADFLRLSCCRRWITSGRRPVISRRTCSSGHTSTLSSCCSRLAPAAPGRRCWPTRRWSPRSRSRTATTPSTSSPPTPSPSPLRNARWQPARRACGRPSPGARAGIGKPGRPAGARSLKPAAEPTRCSPAALPSSSLVLNSRGLRYGARRASSTAPGSRTLAW